MSLVDNTSEFMTGDDSLKEMLNEIDYIAELLANAKIAEQFHQLNQEMQEAETVKLEPLEEAKRQVKELEDSVNMLTVKENTLKKKYDERIERMTEYKGELARYDIEIEQDELACKEFEDEMKDIEAQLQELLSIEQNIPSVNDGLLQVTLFRGLGINMRVQENDPVRKVTLSSPDRQDILTFLLEEYSPYYTSKRIWDYISNTK